MPVDKRILLIATVTIFYIFTMLSVPCIKAQDSVPVHIEGRDTGHHGHMWDGTFFIPIRALEQDFAMEMQWLGSLKLLHVKLDGVNFRIREGDGNMQVESSLVKITPPRIHEDKIWIPASDVLDVLDYTVEFDPEKNILHIGKEPKIIAGVEFDPQEQTLTVSAEEPIRYNVLERDSFVLQLYQVDTCDDFELIFADEEGDLQKDFPWNMRIAMPTLPGPREVLEVEDDEGYSLIFKFPSRLVGLDYSKERLQVKTAGTIEDYRIIEVDDGDRLVLELEGVIVGKGLETGQGVQIEQVKTDPPVIQIEIPFADKMEYSLHKPDNKSIIVELGKQNYIEDIRWSKEKGLEIVSSKAVSLNSFTLEEPLRKVFDIPATRLAGNASTIDVDDGTIERIRYSQFDQETVRVVLDLNYLPEYRVEEWQERTGSTRIAFQHRVFQIAQEEELTKELYHIKLTGEAEYDVHYLSSPYRVVVDIKNAVLGMEEDMPRETELLRGLRASQFSRDPDVVRVVFDLAHNPKNSILSSPRSDTITLEFTKSPFLGRVIVIDPGHGGFDPGAIGPAGTYEKDIVLDISLRLRELLQPTGVRIIMTRDKDEFVSLWARTELANKVNADAFISVHANAHVRGIPEGIETYISPRCHQYSFRLAEFVHREVVRELGLRDRGVKQENYKIIDPLKVPGILLEVAFLSNPLEERILRDANRRQDIAEAIFRGLNEYFTQLRREGR